MTRPQTKETWFIFLSVIFVSKVRGVLCEINTLFKLFIQIRNISLSNIPMHKTNCKKFLISSLLFTHSGFPEPQPPRSIFFSLCQNSFSPTRVGAPTPSRKSWIRHCPFRNSSRSISYLETVFRAKERKWKFQERTITGNFQSFRRQS